MEAESFFARWSKRNAEAAEARESEAASTATARQSLETARTPPTLDEVSLLTSDSDFTRFVAPGVDETIRRSAMKKLFADPQFNVMDGLDVYIEDYHTFTPIPAAILAALNHAKCLLDPLAQADSALQKLREDAQGNDASGETGTDDSEAASEDMTEAPDGAPGEDQTPYDDPVQGM